MTDQEQDSKPVFGTPYTDIATQTRPIIVSENNTTVYGVLWDGVNYSEIQSVKVTKIDKTSPNKTAPTIAAKTSRSITINFEQVDQGTDHEGNAVAFNGSTTNPNVSGIPDKEANRRFRLYDSSKQLLIEEAQPSGTGSSHKFTVESSSMAIKDGTKYYVTTYAIDDAGNAGQESDFTEVTTDAIPGSTTATGTIPPPGTPPATLSANPEGWTKGNVTVSASIDTASYPSASGYAIEMNTSGSSDGGEFQSSMNISTNNTTVYAYLTDRLSGEAKGYANRKFGATLTVTKIDTNAPTTSAPEASVTTNSITVTNKQIDQGNGNSGSGLSKVIYEIATDTGFSKNKQTYEETSPSTNTTHTFTGLVHGTKYYMRTTAYDNVIETTKNSSTATTGETTTSTVPTGDASLTLSPSTTSWTSNDITVTATYSNNPAKSYPIQFKVGSGGWTDGSRKADGTGYTVSVGSNVAVLARLRDVPVSGATANYGAQTSSASLTITKIDKDNPSISSISQTVTKGDNTVSTTAGDWGKSVRIYCTATDPTSPVSNIQYSLNNSTGWTNMTYHSASGNSRTYYVDFASNTAATGQNVYFRATDSVTVGTAHTSALSGNGTTYKCDTQAPNTTAPTVSNIGETSFTITCNQADQGNSGIGARWYSCTTNNGTSWVAMSGASVTVDNLQDGTTYYVKTYARDNALNSSSATGNATPTTVEAGVKGSDITKDDYGKIVVGYKSSSSSNYDGDWRIFYKDIKYIYLISDKCVESFQPTNNLETEDQTSNYIAKNFLLGLRSDPSETSKVSVKATLYMINPDHWKRFLDTQGKAEFAMGGPVATMYAFSYSEVSGRNFPVDIQAEYVTLNNYVWSSTHYPRTGKRILLV